MIVFFSRLKFYIEKSNSCFLWASVSRLSTYIRYTYLRFWSTNGGKSKRNLFGLACIAISEFDECGCVVCQPVLFLTPSWANFWIRQFPSVFVRVGVRARIHFSLYAQHGIDAQHRLEQWNERRKFFVIAVSFPSTTYDLFWWLLNDENLSII